MKFTRYRLLKKYSLLMVFLSVAAYVFFMILAICMTDKELNRIFPSIYKGLNADSSSSKGDINFQLGRVKCIARIWNLTRTNIDKSFLEATPWRGYYFTRENTPFIDNLLPKSATIRFYSKVSSKYALIIGTTPGADMTEDDLKQANLQKSFEDLLIQCRQNVENHL